MKKTKKQSRNPTCQFAYKQLDTVFKQAFYVDVIVDCVTLKLIRF